jgi:hypothetical protein
MLKRLDLRRRARAGAIHLLISAAVAALAAILVFGVWYPGDFRLMAGGQGLFILVVSVDVVLGPLLTFAVFDVTKGWKHLRRDLAVIAILQASALAYGVHTVYEVRPVAMVFEVDRLRLVAMQDVYLEELSQAAPEYRRLPLTGPWLLGARATRTPAEKTEALLLGLKGFDTGQRPPFWQPYAMSVPAALAKSRPLSELTAHYPTHADAVRTQLRAMKADEATGRFLPVIARGDWVAILDASGSVLGYLPYEGFF